MGFGATRKRAAKWALVCAQIVLASLTARAEPARLGAPESVAAAQPLRFFTIAERLATLKASGALPAQETASPARAEPALPAPQTIGLRLASPDAPSEMLLGAIPFTVPGGELSRKWRGALARWHREEAVITRCGTQRCAHAGARRWLEIRNGAASLAPDDQLAYVQHRVNASIRYLPDSAAFGTPDYWASPLEVMMKAGDCEDFAIAKYLMLRSLGIASTQMKIVALRDSRSGEFHAILAVRQGAAWVYLDNRLSRLAQEADYADAIPLASIDDDGQAALIRTEIAPPLRLSTL